MQKTGFACLWALVLLFFYLYSCKPASPSLIKKAGWLMGTWECKIQGASIYETWIKVNEQEFFAKSYALQNNKDTLVFEEIRLVHEHDSLFYIPLVRNQNNHLPVRFSQKLVSATILAFENPGHDFPQLITYTYLGNDSLLAEISGIEKGKGKKEFFAMKRKSHKE